MYHKYIIESIEIDTTPYTKATNFLFTLMEDLFERLHKFLSTLCHSAECKDVDNIKQALVELLKAKFISCNIKDNTVLVNSVEDIVAKWSKYVSYFENDESVCNAFDILVKPSSPTLVSCNNCRGNCKLYECYLLSCNHMVDRKCFEKYFNLTKQVCKRRIFTKSF